MVSSAIFILYLKFALTWRVVPMTSPNDVLKSVVVWSRPGQQESKNRRKAWALITTFITALIIMKHEAPAQEVAAKTVSGLTCNINGIPALQRARYGLLVAALRRAIQTRRELPNGYAFLMDTQQINTGQLVEWVELEGKCCPFFGFEIRWDRQPEAVWLHLTGPEGVKPFILDEFGLR
jgi:hypothetical protein